MDYRKELSQKSKKLIRDNFASDIFNIKTGYYKSEHILPVCSKPNEIRRDIKEFVPKFKELKHYERNFKNNISNAQKQNSEYMSLKPNFNRKNNELETKRNRSNDVKNNCFDKRGHFSAKKLYLLDVLGKDKKDMNNDDAIRVKRNKKIEKNRESRSIRDNRDHRSKSFYQEKKMIEKRIHGSFTINIDQDIFNKTYINLKKTNCDNNNNSNSSINLLKNNLFSNYQKDSKKCKNIIANPITHSYKIIYTKKTNNKTSNNKTNNNINKINNNNRRYKYKYPKENIPKIKLEKTFYPHPKDITKVFSSDTFNPIRKNIKKIDLKVNGDQELFNLEIKNFEYNKTEHILPDEKIVKNILYKNGLHVYDFNADGLNGIYKEKKIEAKLRKNKGDENFDKNYRKAITELGKYNITMDKSEIVDGKGFQKEPKKKRRCTPGNALYRNNKDKDKDDKNKKNTKLKTGLRKK